MIVVVAAFPVTENKKDGMVQRVLHIDSLIEDCRRVYLDISFRRFFRRSSYIDGFATVYRLNFFVHAFFIARMIRRAKIIYIHSAYNALKSIAFRTSAHIVFDVHGVVPEELSQENKNFASLLYNLVERIVIRRCNTMICVTRSMLTHLKDKYVDDIKCDVIILPILPKVDDDFASDQILCSIRDGRSVIYAGGMQAWQNVGKMLDAVKSQSNLNYTFLTGETQRFNALLSEKSLRKINCFSVRPEEVKDHYLSHEYGFILRDEMLVNKVACPTKLVEYLYWGVIPIIITHNIGDFDSESLSGVTLGQFIAGDFPDKSSLKIMRENNYQAVKWMINAASVQQTKLQNFLIKFASS